MLFNIKPQNHLEPVREVEFKLEKEIQELTERNLKALFNLDLVKSEFKINSFRIDSLAFDRENSSFVVVEYKRDKSFSVVDQGIAYLSLLLNNKAEFVLAFNEVFKVFKQKNDFDWSQIRVIFVAPLFTTFQKEAINFKDFPIELWEIKRYSNETVAYNHIPKANPTESLKAISKTDEQIEQVSQEILVYTEESHLEKASPEIQELYERLKSEILNIGVLEIKAVKKYVSFKADRNIVDVHMQQKALKIWINLHHGELDDPKKLTRDVSKTGHWGNGDYEIQISNDEHLDYIVGLVKQAYRQKAQ